MSKNIRIGLIGFGKFAQKRAESLSSIENVQINALFEPYKASQEDCLERFPNTVIYSDLEEMIENDSIDLFIISSPNHNHFEQCRDLLKRSANILCEKPVAIKEQDVQELSNLFTNSNSKVFHMGSNLSYFPSYHLLLKYLRKETCKNIHSIKIQIGHTLNEEKCNWRFNKDLSGGGTLIDNGTHALYFLNQILGPLNFIKTKKIAIENKIESEIEIELETQNKEISKIELSSTWNKDIGYSSIVLTGNEATITANAFDEFITIESNGETNTIKCTDLTQSLNKESQEIVLRLQKDQKYSNIEGAKQTVRIINQCYDSCIEI